MKASEKDKPVRSKAILCVGVGLILLSGVSFFTMLAVPFFSMSTGQKSLLAGSLFFCTQISWWVGAALVGPVALKGLKSRFSSKR